MTDTAVSTPPTADIYREIESFRSNLLNLEQAASLEMSKEYARIQDQLSREAKRLGQKIEQARRAGEPISPSWLFQQDRYKEMLRRTESLMNNYGQITGNIMTEAQTIALRESMIEGANLLPGEVGASLATGFASIPDASVRGMVGAIQDQAPVGQLLSEFGPSAARDVKNALLTGLTLGYGADQTARAVVLATNITRARAEAIVRTETMRATRVGTLAAFELSGVVRGWRWIASLSTRTCAACLGQHGKVFPLSERMAAHVMCRCTMSPVLLDEEDLPAEFMTGQEWLMGQPFEIQRQVLGTNGAMAFGEGVVVLGDFQRTVNNSVWGKSVQVNSFPQALKQAGVSTEWWNENAVYLPAPTTRNPVFSAPVVTAPPITYKLPVVGDSRGMDETKFTNLNNLIANDIDDWDITYESAAREYFGNSYDAMNGIARGTASPEDLNEGAFEYYTGKNTDLSNTINTFGIKATEPFTVFRGIPRQDMGSLQVGTQILDDGFMSTSINSAVAEGFTDFTYLMINIPEGTKFLPADGLTHIPSEEEILFDKGSRLVIREVIHEVPSSHPLGTREYTVYVADLLLEDE